MTTVRSLSYVTVVRMPYHSPWILTVGNFFAMDPYYGMLFTMDPHYCYGILYIMDPCSGELSSLPRAQERERMRTA